MSTKTTSLAEGRQQQRRQSLPTNPAHYTSHKQKENEREEENIRKQQLRLENEKQRIRAEKNEEFQRRLSEQRDPAPKKISSQDRQRKLSVQQDSPGSKSYTKPEATSKLFDYENDRPRSRRELMQPGLNSETATRITSPSASGRISAASSRSGHRGSVAPAINVAHETRAAARSSVDLGERKVNFDDNKLGAMLGSQRPRSRSISDPTRMEIPVVQVDGKDNDTEKLRDLYDIAIEKVKCVDESLLIESKSAPGSRTRVLSNTSFAGGFDAATLKELESILKDARSFSTRRSSKEDASVNRAQKKRIEHLEKVLKSLKPEDHQELDPMKVLQCRYLRLSKSNVATLEEQCRQEGRDPGIHAHKDVTDYDIWEGLKEERRDSLDIPKK